MNLIEEKMALEERIKQIDEKLNYEKSTVLTSLEEAFGGECDGNCTKSATARAGLKTSDIQANRFRLMKLFA